MSYSNPLFSSLSLGVSNSGLQLYAQLTDISGANIGGQINTGFFEVDSGDYGWYYNQFPYLFRGGVKIYNANTSGYLAFSALNPEESFLPDVVNTQHGSGNYVVSNVLIGKNIFTISLTDQLSDPISDSRVEIYPSGTNSLIGLGYSNTNTGQVIFNVDNGKYEVFVSKPQFAYFSNPFYFDIESNVSGSIQGNAYVYPGASMANTVRVFTFLDDVGLNPQSGIQMSIGPSGVVDYSNSNMLLKQPVIAFSDVSGYCFIDVAANSGPFQVKIPACSFTRYFSTPASGTLNLAAL